MSCVRDAKHLQKSHAFNEQDNGYSRYPANSGLKRAMLKKLRHPELPGVLERTKLASAVVEGEVIVPVSLVWSVQKCCAARSSGVLSWQLRRVVMVMQ